MWQMRIVRGQGHARSSDLFIVVDVVEQGLCGQLAFVILRVILLIWVVKKDRRDARRGVDGFDGLLGEGEWR